MTLIRLVAFGTLTRIAGVGGTRRAGDRRVKAACRG
jgi:hypothetical protein